MAHHNGVLPPGFTRFSTQEVPDAQRVSLWEDHNAKALVALRALPLGPDPLRATELNLALPRLRLARVSGTAHRVERNERDIAAHPAGGIVAYFALDGVGHFFHRHGCEILSPGQGIIYDADQPFTRGFAHGLRELALKIPRASLQDAVGIRNLAQPAVFDFQGLGPHNATGRALAGAVGGALAGRPVAWDALEARLLSLLGALLGGPDRAAGHLATAQALIAAEHSDPSLSAQRIAAAIGLSERHLSRVFAESGHSLPQAILQTRLDAARRLLADPAQRGASMAEIAARTGFASQAQFSRSYRNHFGVPPLRHRRELASGTTA